MSDWQTLSERLRSRFGDAPADPGVGDGPHGVAQPPSLWTDLSQRGSVRRFQDAKPPVELLRTMAALALCTPTKSDLQQRDIIIVHDDAVLTKLKALLANQAWIAGAPVLVVVCANNRRQRLLHRLRGRDFVNDHLDAFFNASVDAGIALAAFGLAAEAAGFGTCPISAIRNHPAEAGALLALPDHVFAVAALAIGLPAEPPATSLRLPLSATVHDNRYSEDGVAADIRAYDDRRAAMQPYPRQRNAAAFGTDPAYTWSEDKVRQYTRPERTGFGAFIRSIGFRLD